MKKTNFKNIVMVGIISVASCFGFFQTGAFADSNSMTITPPRQRIILVPGEKYTSSLNVFNASDSTRDLIYEVSIGSYSQERNEETNDDYGNVNLVDKSSYNQIMDWITLDKTEGVVAPNHSEDITYTIDVPENAPAGGQYATIVVADKTTSSQEGNGNVVIDQTFQFASIIYAEVAGETKEKGEILSNSMPSFLLDGSLKAESMVKNEGNVHTDAEYVLQVTPAFSGEDICTNEEEPETSLILPGTERYHVQSCELPSFGIFHAKQTVRIFGEISTVERTIIVCPLWLMFIVIFVLIILIFWIITRVKNRSNSRG